MAKISEPNTKLDDIQQRLIAQLFNAGIINDDNEILNERAFIKFIDTRIAQIQPMFDATYKDGVVTDQYNYNTLGSEINHLEKMRSQKAVIPISESPYPSPQKVEEYMESRKQKTEKQTAFRKVFGRIFGRSEK